METRLALPDDLNVVNLGLERFAEDLRADGVNVVHLDWRPPANGEPALIAMLAALGERE